jgi:hypothetical protein
MPNLQVRRYGCLQLVQQTPIGDVEPNGLNRALKCIFVRDIIVSRHAVKM